MYFNLSGQQKDFEKITAALRAGAVLGATTAEASSRLAPRLPLQKSVSTPSIVAAVQPPQPQPVNMWVVLVLYNYWYQLILTGSHTIYSIDIFESISRAMWQYYLLLPLSYLCNLSAFHEISMLPNMSIAIYIVVVIESIVLLLRRNTNLYCFVIIAAWYFLRPGQSSRFLSVSNQIIHKLTKVDVIRVNECSIRVILSLDNLVTSQRRSSILC